MRVSTSRGRSVTLSSAAAFHCSLSGEFRASVIVVGYPISPPTYAMCSASSLAAWTCSIPSLSGALVFLFTRSARFSGTGSGLSHSGTLSSGTVFTASMFSRVTSWLPRTSATLLSLFRSLSLKMTSFLTSIL